MLWVILEMIAYSYDMFAHTFLEIADTTKGQLFISLRHICAIQGTILRGTPNLVRKSNFRLF